MDLIRLGQLVMVWLEWKELVVLNEEEEDRVPDGVRTILPHLTTLYPFFPP